MIYKNGGSAQDFLLAQLTRDDSTCYVTIILEPSFSFKYVAVTTCSSQNYELGKSCGIEKAFGTRTPRPML